MAEVNVRRPCPSCPWRVDQDAQVIPGFVLDLAEDLAGTCASTRPNHESVPLGEPMFGCHQSRPGEEFVCAGWLAVEGSGHLSARFSVMNGTMPIEALHPGEGWPELHGSYAEVIEKLRATVRE